MSYPPVSVEQSTVGAAMQCDASGQAERDVVQRSMNYPTELELDRLSDHLNGPRKIHRFLCHQRIYLTPGTRNSSSNFSFVMVNPTVMFKYFMLNQNVQAALMSMRLSKIACA